MAEIAPFQIFYCIISSIFILVIEGAAFLRPPLPVLFRLPPAVLSGGVLSPVLIVRKFLRILLCLLFFRFHGCSINKFLLSL